MDKKVKQRLYSKGVEEDLRAQGINPVLARLLASRGIASNDDVDLSLPRMLPVSTLTNATKMGELLADALRDQKKIVVSCDFDVDGCCAGAVMVRSLRAMGGNVDFAMPDRAVHGYGVSKLLVDEIHAKHHPDIILTVDCGISSHAGIDRANELGIRVLVTDHHIPGDTLPNAECIVNPNQPNCSFASKNLAGVGVAFYTMLALRQEMRARNAFTRPEPNLAELLDIVALATIADVVKLDRNNRILVHQGLKRIREGKGSCGVRALYEATGKNPAEASVFDFGFILGPRINAAGRLEDASFGVQCLISDDYNQALSIAKRLDAINRERREIESEMKDAAEIALEEIDVAGRYSLALFDKDWHQGVIGILSSRIKDKYGLPTITFAPGADEKFKGSGRSIPGLHLRDALDLVDKRNPGVLVAFGGHAMAAGMTVSAGKLEQFTAAFEAVCRDLLRPEDLMQIVETDGEIGNDEISFETIDAINGAIWGQGFPAPLFEAEFEVLQQRLLKDKHIKLSLRKDGEIFEGIWFFHADVLPDTVRLIYSLSVNDFRGTRSIQMVIQGVA